jgi:2-octaprenyl-6-methoxyphenol hydroxylase
LNKPADTEINKSVDVLIVGGGMVGAAAALAIEQACAANPPAIAIVDPAPRPDAGHSSSPSFDARSTAISAGSASILRTLQAWDETAACPIEYIQVSDRGRLGRVDIQAGQYGLDALGYVVENRRLGGALFQALKSSQIRQNYGARVESIKPVQQGMQVVISAGENGSEQTRLSARLVVLADGGRSPLCQRLGIHREITDYRQHAFITNIASESPHHNKAFERFTDSGPLAVLPLHSSRADADSREHRSTLVWTINTEDVDEIAALDDAEFLRRLQQAFGERLGRLQRVGERFHYPLRLELAREQIRPGLVLLGNSAHTLHPVAGQGFNLAMRDLSALAEAIGIAQATGLSPGDMQVLQPYLESQQSDQDRVVFATDTLTRLFSSNAPGRVLSRKLGLLSLELLPELKRQFARSAMGVA